MTALDLQITGHHSLALALHNLPLMIDSAVRINPNISPNYRACGQPYSVNHCLTCKRGGYLIMRHNSIRYLYFAELLSELCKDVVTEPSLLPRRVLK